MDTVKDLYDRGEVFSGSIEEGGGGDRSKIIWRSEEVWGMRVGVVRDGQALRMIKTLLGVVEPERWN